MTDPKRRRAPESQRPRNFSTAASSLDRATYENLRRALTVGRWPDGRLLDAKQREICMEAVLTWEAAHLPPDARTGYIERGTCSDGPEPDRIRILGEE
ncbi:MAG: DUF1315 family protein [Gammaproteobacteria bacterium]|nr:MAG: DUF1315 family protein [Gammaproteobacteria bacterium]